MVEEYQKLREENQELLVVIQESTDKSIKFEELQSKLLRKKEKVLRIYIFSLFWKRKFKKKKGRVLIFQSEKEKLTTEIESLKRKLREVTEEKEKVEKLYHVLEMKVSNSNPELERKCRELSQTIAVLEQKLSWGITENERQSLASEEKLENMLKIKVKRNIF